VPARLVVLVSGEGTTLQALLDACRDPSYGAAVVAVVTDRTGIGAQARARRSGLRAQVVSLADYPERAAWDSAITQVVARYAPDLVVCAGFMKLLGPEFLATFDGRILNTHPSLLPAHPGAHAVRDTLAAGDPETGATVIWVDAGVDTGPIVAQVRVPVLPGDDEDTLHARIKAAEAPLYVETVRRIIQEKSL
jgi:formyltetrahydrofolate-dependent phosphoribosylglycinamide formyltransferase